MVGSFGWSAGDIVTAIEIIWRIIKAFDGAKGAKKQYAASCAFLRSFTPVLERMKLQIENVASTQLQDDMLIQAETISIAYADFDKYLDKKYALSSSKPRDVRRIIASIRWALDDLHEKVQKLQQKVINAVQLFQTFIVQEIQIQVSKIASDVRGAQSGSERREDLLRSISTTLAQINKQNEHLQQASADYQSSLDEQRNEQDEREKTTELELKEISRSQKQLTQSLLELKECIEKQRERAPQSEVADWDEVADQAAEQSLLSKDAQAKTQQELNRTANLLQGTSQVTGNQHVGHLAQKAEGAGRLFGSVTPLAGGLSKFFGGGSSSTPPAKASSNTTSSQSSTKIWVPKKVPGPGAAKASGPVRPRRHADLLTGRRQPQPLPDIRSLPPPPVRYVPAEGTELSTFNRSAASTGAQKPQMGLPPRPALPPRSASIQLPLPSPKTGYVLNGRDKEQQRHPEFSLRSVSKNRPACPPKSRSLRDDATVFVRQPTPIVSDGQHMTMTISTSSSFETGPSLLAISSTSMGSTNPPMLPPRPPPRKPSGDYVNRHGLMPPAVSAMPPSHNNSTDTASTVRDLRSKFEGSRLMGVRSAEI
jgi:hypothetical protein